MEPRYPGRDSVSLAFPTPILQKQFADTGDTNGALHQLALEREKLTPSTGGSNRNGWRSGEDLFEWPGDAIATFRDYVAQGVSEISQFCLEGTLDKPVDIQMDGGAWVNLCRDGAYNTMHTHPNWTWSGVYYVTVGEPDAAAPSDAGAIEILDPRAGASDITLTGSNALPKLVIAPQPGLMLIFPSWVYHATNPFRGQGERISIGFNISLNFED